jgi:glycosyltransferase involved in cell wall biosynthesis
MTKSCFISIIIPVFNEEDCIEKTLDRIVEYMSKKEFSYEIIVADDGSTDKTKDVVEKVAQKYKDVDIKFISEGVHKGKGFAVNIGMKNASGDYVLFLDADLSTDISEFEKFIPYIRQNVDVIIGSRRIPGAEVVVHQPKIREFMGRVFSWLSNFILGTKFSDFTCGFKCFSKKAKEEIFSLQKILNWSFDSEILFLAKKLNYEIKEIPVVWKNDPSTKVKLFRDTVSSFFGLIKILWFHNKTRLFSFLSLLLILTLGLFLRVSIINFGLPSKNLALTTYNPDEAITFYSIEKWQPKKFYFHPTDGFFWGGFHLYPSALSLGVAKILDYVKFGNREFYINNLKEADKLYITVRLLMILCATLSIFIVFLILKSAYSVVSALLGAFLLSILPMHVFNSIYVRPDIMMMFFGLLAIYFSLKVLETNETKYYILSCLAVGFSAGTKLNGAVFGVLPIVAYFLSEKKNKKNYWLFLIPIICLAGLILSSPYILLDFNRTQYSFLRYLKNISGFTKSAGDIGQLVLLKYGPLSYIKHYLKYGCGTAVVVFAILGVVLMLVNVFKNRNKYDIFFLVSGLIVFFVVSFTTKNQVVWYTMPVIPFVLIFVSRGMEIIYKARNKLSKTIFVLLTIFLSCYTLIYTLSYWRLYREKNVREEASEWIEKNIPKGARVAIARSYFWTPPVLRQYNPPYKILMGADPVKSSVQEGVLGLKNLLDETEYVVLTEYEFRWALHPKLQKYFPEHKKILDEIFYSGKFIKLAEFDKEAKFLVFKFKKNYPPIDWLIPNPRIIIFKKT